MNITPLKKLANHSISKMEAYRQITGQKSPSKRARFVKMRMHIRDQKVISGALNTLFIVPLPLGLIKPFIKRHKDPNVRAFAGSLQGAKGTRIDIQSKDANIHISII